MNHHVFSERFNNALVLAARLHQKQYRKLDNTPYIGHLLGVASIVIEMGGSEDEAIAALLHDAIEDQGGGQTRQLIEKEFGLSVRLWVDECSDTDQIPKPPWKARKEAYLAHLAQASDSARMISAADKLHNLRSLIRSYQRDGEAIWSSFNGKKNGTLWYYEEIIKVLKTKGPEELALLLEESFQKLIQLIGRNS